MTVILVSPGSRLVSIESTSRTSASNKHNWKVGYRWAIWGKNEPRYCQSSRWEGKEITLSGPGHTYAPLLNTLKRQSCFLSYLSLNKARCLPLLSLSWGGPSLALGHEQCQTLVCTRSCGDGFLLSISSIIGRLESLVGDILPSIFPTSQFRHSSLSQSPFPGCTFSAARQARLRCLHLNPASATHDPRGISLTTYLCWYEVLIPIIHILLVCCDKWVSTQCTPKPHLLMFSVSIAWPGWQTSQQLTVVIFAYCYSVVEW